MRSRFNVAAVVVCVSTLLAVLVATQSGHSASSVPAAPTWQHLALSLPEGEEGGAQRLAQQINKLGTEGWELVDVESFTKEGTTFKTVYYFKKQT